MEVAATVGKVGTAMTAKLTLKESEMIVTILRGYTTAEAIAAQMGITVRTARTHLANIYAKVGAANKTELVLMAMGWIGNHPGIKAIGHAEWDRQRRRGRVA